MLTSEPSEGIGSNSSLPQTAVPRTINCISNAAYSAFYKKTIPVLGPHDENKLGVYKSAPSRTNRCLSHFHLIAQGGCSGDEDGKEADRRKTWWTAVGTAPEDEGAIWRSMDRSTGFRLPADFLCPSHHRNSPPSKHNMGLVLRDLLTRFLFL